MRLIALFLAALAMSAEPGPDATIRDFYKTYVNSGLPTPAQLQTLSPYLSGPLRQALLQARQTQALCKKAHPDEKPPFIEGDLFTSNTEGFTTITAIRDTGHNIFEVRFQYVENGHKFDWSDRVVLVKLPTGKWAIDDIRFRDSATSLRQSLTQKGC
jgi:hypothetical protein